MNKKIIIGVLALILLIGAYVGYSFFQAYKIKKYVTESVGDIKFGESSNLSVGEISINDFPLSRKIKLNNVKMKHAKGGLTVTSAEINTDILAKNLTIGNIGLLAIEDQNGNVSKFVELKPDVLVKVNFDEKNELFGLRIINLGYKTLDKDKKPILDSQQKDAEMVLTVDKQNLRYDNHGSGYVMHDLTDDTIVSGDAFSFVINCVRNGQGGNAKIDLSFAGFKRMEKGTVISDDKNGSLVLSAEAIVTPNNSDKKIPMIPEDKIAELPPQMQESFYRKPFAYIWSLDLKNFALSTQNYKLTSSGNMANSVEEDNIPSVQMVMKIENFDALIADIKSMLERSSAKLNKELVAQQNSPVDQTKVQMQQTAGMVQMGVGFLNSFSDMAKKVATKNALSKDNLSVFEFKREKGGQLAINSSSLAELFADYMKSIAPNPATAGTIQPGAMPVQAGQMPGNMVINNSLQAR